MKMKLSILFAALFSTTVSFAQLPDLPVTLKNGTGVVIGNTAYVGLGSAGNQWYSLQLNSKDATWKALATFPAGGRDQPVAAAVKGKIYVFGGSAKDENGILRVYSDAYRYDPNNNTWEKLPTSSPIGVVGTSAVDYQDKILLSGGVNKRIFDGIFEALALAGGDKIKQNSALNSYFNQPAKDYFFNQTVAAYDPEKNVWENWGNTPFSGRAGASLTVNADTLLLVNGEIKPGLRTADAAKGKINKGNISWQDLPKLIPNKGENIQEGLAGAYAGYSNGHYLIAGGANFPGSTKQYQSGEFYAHKGHKKVFQKTIFSLDNNQWKIVGELPEGMGYGVTLPYKDELLLVGGELANGKASAKIYHLSYKDGAIKITK